MRTISHHIEIDVADKPAKIIDELNRKMIPEGLKTSGEIFSSAVVPVLANSCKPDVQSFAMYWGTPSIKNGRMAINVRSETVATKTMFKEGML